jgi:hypothetical protein
MTRTDGNRRRRVLIAAIIGTILAAVFGLTSLAATAGGHGTYIPIALFFPVALLVAIQIGVISNAVLFVAVMQWSLYGATVSVAADRGRARAAILCITVVHALLVVTCFLIDRSDQFL